MSVHPTEYQHGRIEIANNFVSEALQQHKHKIDLIMLFGSVAKNEDTGGSDIDVLVVEKGDRFKMRRDLSSIVSKLLLESGEYLSVKTLSDKEFGRLKSMKSSFIHNVLKDGRVLYRRS